MMVIFFGGGLGWYYLQVPELFGPIRTIAEGRGETVLIGTTKNFVLQGSLDGEFVPITQVQTYQKSLFKLNLKQFSNLTSLKKQ